jgi:hypothetical protein
MHTDAHGLKTHALSACIRVYPWHKVGLGPVPPASYAGPLLKSCPDTMPIKQTVLKRVTGQQLENIQ